MHQDLKEETRTDTKTLSHGLKWRGLWVLQMTLLPNSWPDLYDVKRECIICQGKNFWYKLWALRLMTDRAILTVSQFCTKYFTNEELCISGRSHFLGDFSLSLIHI